MLCCILLGMKWAIPLLASILILGSLGLSQQAFAIPVSVSHTNSSPCDVLLVPDDVDELGTSAPFISGFEAITSSDTTTPLNACPSVAEGSSLRITIKNLTPDDFIDGWYVSDDITTITNFDGTVNGEEAFKIDSVGLNKPLVFESITSNDIFEAGETWDFIIDDYSAGFGLAPSLFDSVGVPSDTSNIGPSTGSIIAYSTFVAPPVGGTVLPIDTTALLVAGAQTMTPWLILGVLSAVGIGLAVFTLKRNH